MALQLFVNPGQGAQSAARSIERGLTLFGAGAGQAFSNHKAKKIRNEKAGGLLAEYDPDGIREDLILQRGDKQVDEQEIEAYYSNKYPSLTDKEGLLSRLALRSEIEKDELAKTTAQAQLDLARLQRDKVKREEDAWKDPGSDVNILQDHQVESGKLANDAQRLKNEAARRDLDQTKGLVGQATDFVSTIKSLSWTGDVEADENNVVSVLNDARELAATIPTSPQGRALAEVIKQVESSPDYTRHAGKLKTRATALSAAEKLAPNYTRVFQHEIMSGLTTPIDRDKLAQEFRSGQINGEEQWKVRTTRMALQSTDLLSRAPAPGYLSEIIGVPSIEEISRQGRMPTKGEVKRFEDFARRYEEKDLSLFSGVTNTPTAMQLSAMNEEAISDGDRNEIASLVNSSNGVNKVVDMLTDDGSETLSFFDGITHREVDAVETGRIRGIRNRVLKTLTGGGDYKMEVVSSLVKQLVADLARGVFGEVGVLTDADMARYEGLMADVNSPTELNLILSDLLLDTLRDKADTTFKTLAQQGKNVSGFLSQYASLQPNLAIDTNNAKQILKLSEAGKILPNQKASLVDPKTRRVLKYTITDPVEFESYLRDVNAGFESLRESIKDPVKPATSSQAGSPSGPGTGKQLMDLTKVPGIWRDAAMSRNYFKNATSETKAGNLFGGYFEFPDEREQQALELLYAAEGKNSKGFAKLVSAAKAGDKQALNQLQDLSLSNRRMNALNLISAKAPVPFLSNFLPRGKYFLNR